MTWRIHHIKEFRGDGCPGATARYSAPIPLGKRVRVTVEVWGDEFEVRESQYTVYVQPVGEDAEWAAAFVKSRHPYARKAAQDECDRMNAAVRE